MKSLIPVLTSLGLAVCLQAQTPAGPPKPVTPVKPPVTPTGQPTVPGVPKVPSAKPPVGVPGAPVGAVPKNPAPTPGSIPGVNPAGRAAAQVPVTGPDAMAAKAGQVIDGSNWDDQDVADEYSKYTGKRVLLSSATQNLEIRFYQRGPLTNRQAADMLVKILDMEGFVFVPSGTNEVKLLAKAQGSTVDTPGSYNQELIHEPEMLPEGDVYASYFMKMKFIKPEEAIRIFTQSVNGLDAGTKLAPVPNASGIIITSRASFIRKLINQQKVIDVTAGTQDTVWVTLKYADSEEVAATLNEIMNAQQQRKTTAGVTTAGAATTRGRVPGVPGSGKTGAATNAKAASAAGEDIPVQIVANPRLNKIFIMGRPVDIVFVEGLARQFDAPPNRNTFLKRQLRFMIASDFLQVAADALEANNTSGNSQTQGGGARGSNNRQTTQNRNQPSQNNRNNGQNGNGGGSQESVQAFNVSDVPESMVVGKTFIVADNVANSILVQGPPESLRIVSELMDKLDGRPQQVMISTVFGEITLGDDKDVGVSIGHTATGNANNAAGSSGAGGILQDLSALGTIAGLNNAAAAGSTAAGLNLYGTVKDFTGMIRALETRTDFKVLSRPTVYTANNRVAVISSGRRIAVPTNTFSSGGTGTASQSTNIEYRDVLLRFEVVPLINSEHEVTLRISLLNEDTQGSQIIDGNTIPTIVTESLSTTVTVANNSTVVLGGLVTESTDITKSGVPILGRIPVLGRLFRRDVKVEDRRELIIFIQPKIISNDDSQRAAQADMERRYDVAPSTRDFADGVLPRKQNSRKAAPTKKARSKTNIPTASKRPSMRYPTRR